MNQIRTTLLLATLAVAYLLWTAWNKDYAPPPASPAPVAAASTEHAPSAAVPAAAPVAAGSASAAPGQLIDVSTDVLKLQIDTRGGSLVHAELLDYAVAPRTRKDPDPAPTVLLTTKPDWYFVAQDGLVSSSDPAAADQPDHRALFSAAQTSYALAPGQDTLVVALSWHDAAGLKVVKTYTFKRGSYVIGVRQQIDNGSAQAWQGNPYRQLQRVEPPQPSGWLQSFSHPESRSFQGAAWYDGEKFDKLSFKDYAKPRDQLDAQIKGGWAAMLRLYFFAAWIPPASETDHYATAMIDPEGAHPRYLIRAVGPAISVPAGGSASTDSRLYVGPNLQGKLDAIAPGLDLTIDYGMLKAIAVPMHWVLSQLCALVRNWGVAIILLVLLIKGATWKLTAVQYRSGAAMRKLQPRVQALKERYGDDKVKLQQAMMELYKKEKVNPMGGCLPMLITMPVFYGLYYVLSYSLELRHAAFLWIPDLSAPDPYYILPGIYAIVMLATQWLNPAAAGMDPTQAKMMKILPLVFTVMFAFFPAGLCLYYAVNGLVGLSQQWWILRSVERKDLAVKAG